jgi:hypothetical protein
MRSNVVRFSLVAVVLALTVAVVGVRTYTASSNNQIDVQSFHWHIAPTQIARVCLANTVTPGDPAPTETFSLNFVAIKDQFGRTAIERPLRIPVGESRCTGFSYQQIVDAGVGADPLAGRTFLIFVSRPKGTSDSQNTGLPQQMVGAIETLDENGQTRIYLGIHWRFD